jgi:hypothetical protein
MNEPRPDQGTDFGRPADERLTTAALAETGDGAPAETRTFAQADQENPDSSAPIFPNEEAEELRHAWDRIQTSFVDEPRRAVEDADHLVATTMKRLAEIYADERAKLEGQWDRGDDVSTEDLRVALRRYRSFFGRLLSA